jgi:C-terminal processing protease CtpA/Prc
MRIAPVWLFLATVAWAMSTITKSAGAHEVAAATEPVVTELLAAMGREGRQRLTPHPLSARGEENLIAFARLYGYLRHFDAGDAALAADWDHVAVAGVSAIEEMQSPDELAATLQQFFSAVSPAVHVWTGAPHMLAADPPPPGADRIRAWVHWGFQLEPGTPYRSRLVTAVLEAGSPDSMPNPARPRLFKLTSEVYASSPLAAYVSAETAAPLGASSVPRPPSGPPPATATDRTGRLASVIVAWNVIQHSYPYFDVIEVDWEAELRAALVAAAVDEDPAAFRRTLQQMFARLADGHTGVGQPEPPRVGAAALNWDWIEGQLVVTGINGSASPIEVGDVILSIDGQPIDEVVAELKPRATGTTPNNWPSRALAGLLWRPFGTETVVDAESVEGNIRRVALEHSHARVIESRPAYLAELAPGIRYVDLTRIPDSEFREAVPYLAAATGIVFDLRGYPAGMAAHEVVRHLLASPVEACEIIGVPLFSLPDREDMRFTSRPWQMQPLSPHIGGQALFLTDSRAISAAETVLGWVEVYKLGDIVGGPTAGTNGNINLFKVPTGHELGFTGAKAFKPDCSLFHHNGVHPSIPVARTRAGVVAGRDELLEAALRHLRDTSNRQRP